jgi:hypothetical protein
MAAKTRNSGSPLKQAQATGKVVLYTLIEGEQQRALRVLAFMRHTGIAELVREAIDQYLEAKGPSAEEVENFVKLVRKSVRAR